MALDTQVISIPFTKGQETKIDPALVDQSSLLSIVNGYFGKTGSILRRDAWLDLYGGTIPALTRALCAFNNELLVISGKTLSSYSSAQAASVARGTVSPIGLSRQSVQRATDY